jgi:hypothetical protein
MVDARTWVVEPQHRAIHMAVPTVSVNAGVVFDETKWQVLVPWPCDGRATVKVSLHRMYQSPDRHSLACKVWFDTPASGAEGLSQVPTVRTAVSRLGVDRKRSYPGSQRAVARLS